MMKNKRTLLAALAAAACLAAPTLASAQAAITDDVNCVAVALKLAGDSNPDIAQAGTLSAFYFAGRVEGRDPRADVMELAAMALARMSPTEIQANAARCGKQLEAKGAEWTAKSKDLEARGY
jgi:hypothetical protein